MRPRVSFKKASRFARDAAAPERSPEEPAPTPPKGRWSRAGAALESAWAFRARLACAVAHAHAVAHEARSSLSESEAASALRIHSDRLTHAEVLALVRELQRRQENRFASVTAWRARLDEVLAEDGAAVTVHGAPDRGLPGHVPAVLRALRRVLENAEAANAQARARIWARRGEPAAQATRELEDALEEHRRAPGGAALDAALVALGLHARAPPEGSARARADLPGAGLADEDFELEGTMDEAVDEDGRGEA